MIVKFDTANDAYNKAIYLNVYGCKAVKIGDYFALVKDVDGKRFYYCSTPFTGFFEINL